MEQKRYCQVCNAQVLWAYDDDGTLLLVDRQESADGDLVLVVDAEKRLRAERRDGFGLNRYRLHRCPEPRKSPRRRHVVITDVDAALLEADRIAPPERRSRGRVGMLVGLLAAEVRRIRVTGIEREAIDALLAEATRHELPPELQRALEQVRVSRTQYYM